MDGCNKPGEKYTRGFKIRAFHKYQSHDKSSDAKRAAPQQLDMQRTTSIEKHMQALLLKEIDYCQADGAKPDKSEKTEKKKRTPVELQLP